MGNNCCGTRTPVDIEKAEIPAMEKLADDEHKKQSAVLDTDEGQEKTKEQQTQEADESDEKKAKEDKAKSEKAASEDEVKSEKAQSEDAEEEAKAEETAIDKNDTMA